ncbi:class I SAM-dependent rRNA methyltransferase [Thermaerobacter sp. PB12/4term]|uniref:class I SAM-dependent rRNA methyltransferase n=1 Tax=Thermaerobacter sp. PB12/4term TaxID=2293838 RepID=UPI0013149F4B|nr:class I SAM-dependent rRNA methyltransferase [Thermaerobacter sp. PB12/4term]QIA27349.1 class I SAM-dependent rRNA methyltransferase [Thermaerobacter sp. PB12/4term]
MPPTSSDAGDAGRSGAGPAMASLPRERATRVQLKPGRDAALRQGRLWVYRTDVYTVSDDAYDPGDIVQVVDARGRFVGKGYINPRSMIFVRLLTADPDEAIDRAFFRRRLERALALRQRLQAAQPDTDSFRLVFAEADLLPALIVDRFAGVLVIQTLALGIDRWQPLLVELLDELAAPQGIYERNDVPVRELEGLPQRAGFLRGRFDPRVVIRENGLPLVVDLARGHKTGYFLDQRDNRAALRRYVKGARVLDAFCHTGAFTCHALAYGAREVVAVDIQEEVLAVARENVEQVRRQLGSGEARVTFHHANAFDFLRARAAEGDRYDVIILDPPAFAKNRQALPGAYRGYKEVNLRAMKMLPPGGILVTCSCSYHMTRDLFEEMLRDAARDVGRRVRILERRGAAPDHPVLLGAGESDYLKCYIVEVW